MPDTPVTETSILHDSARLGPDDCFTFGCGNHLDCFTRCCRDVAIVLTPYDVLRLKRALGMDSSEFLEKYTICPFTPDQKFPVRLLRMTAETKQCPFVCDRGCAVYNDRPWACRMYPLGVAEPRNATATDRAFHFLVVEDLCHGHGTGREYTIRRWTAEQGAEEYEANGAGFKKLTLHEFWDGKQALTPARIDMFHMACYDLDRFRRFVFESKFLDCFEVDEARIEAIRADDEELLDFAMDWLRFSLFCERTMKLKRSVLEARSRG
jgi:Fe-S-cluster containining protein